MNGALKRYRIMAYAVGIGLILLVVVAVPLKYWAGVPEVAKVVGQVHGALYILYLVAVLDLFRRARLSPLSLLAMVAAGFLPGLAFFVERRITATVVERRAPRPEPPSQGPGQETSTTRAPSTTTATTTPPGSGGRRRSS